MNIVPTEAREHMKAAQFFYGEGFTDWAWQERARASTLPPKSSKAWPFVRFADQSNVVEMPRKGRK